MNKMVSILQNIFNCHYISVLFSGALCNGHVRCPWHGACFNIRTGDIEDFPGLDSVPKFQVLCYNITSLKDHLSDWS